MAHQSRANTCRANTTYMGLYITELYASLAGTDITDKMIKESLVISQRVGASTCDVSLRDTTVTPGQELIIRDGGSMGRYLFRGRVLPRRISMAAKNTLVRETITASDRWFLDRFRRVTKDYGSQPVNGIVADILATFADGWRPGQIDSSLGPFAMSFQNELVSRALERLAACAGAYLRISPFNTVSIVSSVDDGHAITLDNSATDFWAFEATEDLSQVRTRVIVEGDGADLAADTGVDDTTITLEQTDPFSSTGGSARLKDDVFTYTGKTATTLTGVSGLMARGFPGDRVVIHVQKDDAAAQSTLATTLGGGASGIVTHHLTDDRFTHDEADARAQEDLDRFKDALWSVRYQTRSKFVQPLKNVTVSMTSPKTISETAVIDEVTITPAGKFESGSMKFLYEVVATPARVKLEDLLTRVEVEQI